MKIQFDSDTIDRERKRVIYEHACGCEVCSRSGALCPASASSIIEELAAKRLEVVQLLLALTQLEEFTRVKMI